MKRLIVVVIMVVSVQAQSQSVVAVIKEGVKKAIKAVDLKIQRLQNKTIWLQNAQKAVENSMSKLKLAEISDWAEKQRKLYDDYFQELWKVKVVLIYYHRVKDITDRQIRMVNEFKAAWSLFRQDRNFTTNELKYMSSIYSGMLGESLTNIDQLYLVIKAFATRMPDGKRLEIINRVADNLEQLVTDVKEFNNQNKMMSLQRASEKGEIETVKRLYGL